MNIIIDRPPNYSQIVQVLPKASKKGVIFTYGDTIYNPWNVNITHPLEAHESVHAERQGVGLDGIEAWWDRYLKDIQFRFQEELIAHQAEYWAYNDANRNARRKALSKVARKLASPLYGNMITIEQAKRGLKKAKIDGDN